MLRDADNDRDFDDESAYSSASVSPLNNRLSNPRNPFFSNNNNPKAAFGSPSQNNFNRHKRFYKCKNGYLNVLVHEFIARAKNEIFFKFYLRLNPERMWVSELSKEEEEVNFEDNVEIVAWS